MLLLLFIVAAESVLLFFVPALFVMVNGGGVNTSFIVTDTLLWIFFRLAFLLFLIIRNDMVVPSFPW